MGYKTEKDFFANYNMNQYERPTGYTSDIVIFTLVRDEWDVTKRVLNVLLVKRLDHPGKGKWALPGGFVEHGEDALTGATRELEEETGVSDVFLKHFGVYDAYGRDPRGNKWVITNAHYAVVNEKYLKRRRAGDDAEEVRLIPVSQLSTIEFAFGDHHQIINDALLEVSKDMSTTTVAKEFLEEEFAVSELFDVLKLFGVFPDSYPLSNFYMRVNKASFIDPVLDRRGEHVRRNDRTTRLAKMYRFNDEEPIPTIY